ncbi:uncharacterized protein IUM83_13158 [Phytophthora cinnamomi]|uniref:uncharacterized protein n=1 Tax=Phytophthora cinnamomi TaxID=4785 RepID=UPI00355AC82E|nr:hypothetical protein IUM83_13158 [Phytophthora cinnamomi]
MAQAKRPVLGPELTQPINSTSLDQLVEVTTLLLKAMGYRCSSRPHSFILSCWDVRRAGNELAHWKRRLRAEFGLERTPGAKPTIAKRIADFGDDEAELGNDPWDDRGDPDESMRAQIRRLSYVEEEQADARFLEPGEVPGPRRVRHHLLDDLEHDVTAISYIQGDQNKYQALTRLMELEQHLNQSAWAQLSGDDEPDFHRAELADLTSSQTAITLVGTTVFCGAHS